MGNPKPAVCRVCGHDFIPVPTTRRYCSPACFSQRKRLTYVPGSYTKPKAKERRPCGWCGELFDYHPKVRIRFCSRECGRAARSEGATCVVPWRTCRRCGDAFVAREWRVQCRACSEIVGVRDKTVTAICERCGSPFDYVWRTNRRRFCSKACKVDPEQRRQAKDRRKARRREAYVEDVWRLKVYERDGWRCQLCGRAVRRTAAVPHPLAPTLDHIVPLASGGTHEYANVQTAHFLCNSRKGDRGCDQLRLIG